MAIVVFGGNGFVGHSLVRQLLSLGEQVIVADNTDSAVNSSAQFIQCDVTNPASFNIPFTAGDIAVNLAARQYHLKVPRKNRQAFFFDVNTRGTRNILEFITAAGGNKFIQYTTDMTYGKPHYIPVDVGHPQVPFGPYGASKKAAEDICQEYRQKGIDITIFRPRMINGPGRLGILKKLFWLVRNNLPVPTIGSGENCYQMVSVFDCVSATIAAIKQGCPNREYNLGSKDPPSERMLLQTLVKTVGSRSPIIPTNGAVVKAILGLLSSMGLEIMYKEQYLIADEEYILDISETENDLGWSPQYGDQDMIIAAYQDYMPHVSGFAEYFECVL